MGQRKELVNQTQRCFSEVIDFGRHRNQIKLSLANLSVVVAGVGRPAGQKQNQLPLTKILHDGYVPVWPLSNLTKGEKRLSDSTLSKCGYLKALFSSFDPQMTLPASWVLCESKRHVIEKRVADDKKKSWIWHFRIYEGTVTWDASVSGRRKAIFSQH